MTQLDLAPEVGQLREVVRNFSRDLLVPLAEEAESQHAIPSPVLRGLAELGILSPLDSRSDQVLNPVALVVVAEELAMGDPGVAYEVMAGAHAAYVAGRLGSDEQLRGLTPGDSAASALGSLLIYEGYGRGPDEYETSCVVTGDGVIVEGAKIGVVRPGTADYGVLFGRSDGGTEAILLNRAQLGQATVTRDDKASGKLGITAAHTGDVLFDGVSLPTDVVLVAQTDGEIDRLAASARLSTAAIAVGTGEAAIRYAAEYATTREAFGQLISSYQGVAFPLAEADMQLKNARWAILDLATRLDGIEGSAQLAKETGQVVATAMGAASFATVTGINTLGGHGFLTDHPVERWYRAVGTLTALDHDPLLDV